MTFPRIFEHTIFKQAAQQIQSKTKQKLKKCLTYLYLSSLSDREFSIYMFRKKLNVQTTTHNTPHAHTHARICLTKLLSFKITHFLPLCDVINGQKYVICKKKDARALGVWGGSLQKNHV